MADEVQIRFGADIGGALAGIEALKQAVSGIGEPFARLRSSFGEAGAAFAQMVQAQLRAGYAAYHAAEQRAADQRRLDTAALAAFKANMQAMVDARRLSLTQALGFDIEYSGRLEAEQRGRLEAIMENEAAGIGERLSVYRQLLDAGTRYSTQLAEDQRRLADAARREADRFAQPFRQAFDEIGTGFRSAAIGLIEGTQGWRGAALQAAQSVERGFVGMLGSVASKAAAAPLGSLLGVGAASGEGVSDVLGNAFGKWIFGAPQQVAQGAALTANTAALAANTSAVATLAASLGAAAGIGAAAGTAEIGAAASGGGILGGLFGLLGFARGGIVPSAAKGWALPSFAGAVPALLHSREMVLPAPISEGFQAMLADGGAGGPGGAAHFHAHFHGPADAPAIARWFRDNMRSNAGAIRDMFRANALTPRSL